MPPKDHERPIVERDDGTPRPEPTKRSRVVTEPMRAANARNAQSSCGPTSLEGKAIASGNASKHSLSSNGKALERRYPELFQRHFAELLELYDPTTQELREKVRILAYAAVRLELYHNTQGAAVETARAETMRNWSTQREQAARDTLRRLDDPQPISFGIYRDWLTDYSIAREFQLRITTRAQHLEQAVSITPAELEQLLRLTEFASVRLPDSQLPEPLRAAQRHRIPTDQVVPLSDAQRRGLLELADASQRELNELMELLEPREERLRESALACLEVFGQSRELLLRHRYYMEAERTLLRLTRELSGESRNPAPTSTKEATAETRHASGSTNLPRSQEASSGRESARVTRLSGENLSPARVELGPETLAALRKVAPELSDGPQDEEVIWEAMQRYVDMDMADLEESKPQPRKAECAEKTVEPVACPTPEAPTSVAPGAESINAAEAHGFVSSNRPLASLTGNSLAANPAPPTPAAPAPSPLPPVPTRPTPWTVRRVPPEEQAQALSWRRDTTPVTVAMRWRGLIRLMGLMVPMGPMDGMAD